ncbi:DegT/DnrJ/EryC1/StrS family aminotransferase (plasmid) [Haloferacaceae archaeon DSL9]
MTSISLADPDIGPEEQTRVREVLESGMLAAGPEVRSFEDEFAAYCDVSHGIATSNGTTALETAFRALEIGPGDTVLTTPFSFIASANAIRLCGAAPRFADIDPRTYNLDPERVETILESRGESIDAVLAVHLYGLPAPMDRLAALADEHDFLLVEDAAQAHGATLEGDRVGSLGDAACFSFYPTKNMTTGEGGMIVTDDEAVARRAARFVNHGRTDTYEHAEVGHNFRLTSIAAAIGRAQLEKLPQYTADRRANAARLTDVLTDVDGIEPPQEPNECEHVYHQYTVRCADRAHLQSYLSDAGVDSGVYYPTPIHRQPAYADVDHSAPHAERAATEVLSLPVHPKLTIEEMDRLVELLDSYETPAESSNRPPTGVPGGESRD